MQQEHAHKKYFSTVTMSEFHENAPPWRTIVSLMRGKEVKIRLELHFTTEDLVEQLAPEFALQWWNSPNEFFQELSKKLVFCMPVEQ